MNTDRIAGEGVPVDDSLLEGLWRERDGVTYRADPRNRPPSMGLQSVAALACLMAGAPVASGSGRRLSRSLPPREHFVPDEPLTKRQRRRLRGKRRAK